MAYQPRYSGPDRSGVCVCGHSWDEHHLGMVMRKAYVDDTKEGYIPDECCYYGSNEAGGKKFNSDTREWEDHCYGYRDTKEKLTR